MHGAPSAWCSLLVQSSEPEVWGSGLEKWAPLSLLDSEVVSPPALIADKRRVVLSRENARVS